MPGPMKKTFGKSHFLKLFNAGKKNLFNLKFSGFFTSQELAELKRKTPARYHKVPVRRQRE